MEKGREEEVIREFSEISFSNDFNNSTSLIFCNSLNMFKLLVNSVENIVGRFITLSVYLYEFLSSNNNIGWICLWRHGKPLFDISFILLLRTQQNLDSSTFVTPTLLAGDKSLVNVVLHEIIHRYIPLNKEGKNQLDWKFGHQSQLE